MFVIGVLLWKKKGKMKTMKWTEVTKKDIQPVYSYKVTSYQEKWLNNDSFLSFLSLTC